jgi:hypothetical protein
MKKSLIYGTAAALAILLAFAACEQATDSDSSTAEVIPSYQSELDGIAIAFADGAPTVYLKNDLHINAGELVIPEGKTLDLTDRGRTALTIDKFEAGGKLVILGNISFGQGNSKDIKMGGSGAYLIARKGYVDANVNIVTDPNSYTADPNKHIVATEDQIIYVAEGLNMADSASWEKVITDQADVSSGDYIAVAYTGAIDETIAINISKYGYGRKLYIIGNVTLRGDIKLNTLPSDTEKYRWAPQSTQSSVRNVAYTDKPSSLAIAGNTIFDGPQAAVGTDGGFTVFGSITTGADREDAPINAAGELAAYVVKIDGGASFVGDVTLVSKALTSNFGNSVSLGGSLTAYGPVVVTALSISNGAAIFKGVTEFKGTSVQIPNINNFIFESDVIISAADKPIDLSGNNSLKSLTYENDYIGSAAVNFVKPVTFKKGVYLDDSSSITTSGDATFMGPVTTKDENAGSFSFGGVTTFMDTVKFGSGGAFASDVLFNKAVVFDGVPREFNGGAVFNDVVTFGTDVDPGEAIFAGSVATVEFKNEIRPFYGVEIMNSPVIFNKPLLVLDRVGSFAANATFNDTVNFGSQAIFNGTRDNKVIFNKAADFTGFGSVGASEVTFNGPVSLNPASDGNANLYFDGKVTYKNGIQGSIVFNAKGASQIASEGGAVKLNNGKIIASGDKVTFTAIDATFTNAGVVVTPSTSGSGAVVFGGTTAFNFPGYTVQGTLAAIAGSFAVSNDEVTLSDYAISTNKDQSKLASFGGAQLSLVLKKNFTLDGVELNLTDGGTVSIAQYSLDQINLNLVGGTNGYVTNVKSAGILRTTASKAVAGGTLVAFTGTAPAGVILANGPQGRYNSKFVTDGGTKIDDAATGTIGVLGGQDITLITGDSEITPFYNAQSSADAAWGFVRSHEAGASGAGGGSIAVFTIVDTPTPTPTPPETPAAN